VAELENRGSRSLREVYGNVYREFAAAQR